LFHYPSHWLSRTPCLDFHSIATAPASRTTKIRGDGLAVSIPAHPGECASGTAETFDQARGDFEDEVFLSNRTEADFQERRDARDWTARKYALRDAGKRLPEEVNAIVVSPIAGCKYASLRLCRFTPAGFSPAFERFI